MGNIKITNSQKLHDIISYQMWAQFWGATLQRVFSVTPQCVWFCPANLSHVISLDSTAPIFGICKQSLYQGFKATTMCGKSGNWGCNTLQPALTMRDTLSNSLHIFSTQNSALPMRSRAVLGGYTGYIDWYYFWYQRNNQTSTTRGNNTSSYQYLPGRDLRY